jgi:predicted peroxiredoxin
MMKNILFMIVAGMILISCNQSADNVTDAEQSESSLASTDMTRDGVFIHITEGYNDPHRVLMPMKMATMMAADKDVIVYLDIHAVELLVNGAEDMTFTDFESFQTYLGQLINQNVGVYACPTCLAVAGYTPEDLMEGVQAAEKERFFDFTEGRIVTLDY